MKSARRIRFEARQPIVQAARAERHAQANERRKQQAEWQAAVANTNFTKRNGRKAQKKHAVNGHCPCGGCTLVQTCHE